MFIKEVVKDYKEELATDSFLYKEEIVEFLSNETGSYDEYKISPELYSVLDKTVSVLNLLREAIEKCENLSDKNFIWGIYATEFIFLENVYYIYKKQTTV